MYRTVTSDPCPVFERSPSFLHFVQRPIPSVGVPYDFFAGPTLFLS